MEHPPPQVPGGVFGEVNDLNVPFPGRGVWEFSTSLECPEHLRSHQRLEVVHLHRGEVRRGLRHLGALRPRKQNVEHVAGVF